MQPDSSPATTSATLGHGVKEYAAVVEREADGRYSAYVPDLPGCASMGKTRREAISNVREAVTCYLEGLRKLGRPVPRRRSRVEVVRIKAA
jgi:predicted RNase H-like HicB family nuclease